MRLIKCKAGRMISSVLLLLCLIFSTLSAQMNESKLFEIGCDIGYVAPYVWRGFPMTNGPCIQPQFWVSVSDFKLGVFINMFGSNKDVAWPKVKVNDDANTIEFPPIDSGECSQSFGMINELNFYLAWDRSFSKIFSLLAGVTLYAYGEHIEVDTAKTKYIHRYSMFHENAWYSEFTLRPSFTVGIFNIFTEQNFVLIAPERSFLYQDIGPTGLIWAEKKDSRFGNWHCALGVNIEKELSDEITCCLLLQEEIANRNYFETLYRDPEFVDPENPEETVSIVGAYQQTLRLSTIYAPFPWFHVSANCGIEFITKETISEKTERKGAFIFGGIHTRFSFSW